MEEMTVISWSETDELLPVISGDHTQCLASCMCCRPGGTCIESRVGAVVFTMSLTVKIQS